MRFGGLCCGWPAEIQLEKIEVKKLHRSCLNEAFYSPGRFILFLGQQKGRKRSGISPNKLTGANGPAKLPTLSVDGKGNTVNIHK